MNRRGLFKFLAVVPLTGLFFLFIWVIAFSPFIWATYYDEYIPQYWLTRNLR